MNNFCKILNYYHVSSVGTGTKEDAIRPNIPEDVPFSGCISEDNTYLIATNQDLSSYSQVIPLLTDSDLQSKCADLGIAYEDVLKWGVSE